MVYQFELFPEYPRLAPSVLIPTPHPLFEAWKQFDMPSYDNRKMAESPEHANEIVRIKNAISAILPHFPDAFAAVDTFVYLLLPPKRMVGKPILKRLAPDVFLACNVVKRDRESFNLQREKELLVAQYAQENPTEASLSLDEVELLMFTVEVMSRSNYRDKKDQYKRWLFYQNMGVKEYLVIHTRQAPERKEKELSLEFYVRQDGFLARMLDFPVQTSQMTGLKFSVENNKLVITDLDDNVFFEYEQEIKLRKRAEAEAKLAKAEAKKAKAEEKLAQKEAKQEAEARKKAESEEKLAQKEAKREAEARKKAEAEAEEERKVAEEALQRAKEYETELEELRRLLLVLNAERNVN
jgi:hypothetical protein